MEILTKMLEMYLTLGMQELIYGVNFVPLRVNFLAMKISFGPLRLILSFNLSNLGL